MVTAAEEKKSQNMEHLGILILWESGADPEVEEGGGGHRYKVGLVRLCAKFFRERIMHSVLGRSGGMLLYKFRRYESALTTGL